MALTPATQFQTPDESLLDVFGRQAYLGEQFLAGPDIITLADEAEHPVLYLSNPSTNTKALFNSLRNFNGSADDGNVIVFRVYKNPTGVTGGTTITPQNCRIASALVSGAVCKSSPTVSTNGTRMEILAVGFNAQSIDSTLIIIDPGTSILITAQATGATTAIAEVVYYEL